jgi:hypothetical protein|tara:strand:- start:293 stop:484 length:192 start_codon:yes stop_codon:yes gene_type:complete
MTKKEILDRVQNVLNQGVDTESQDLDLLRHDLENDIIESKITTDSVISNVMASENERRIMDNA